MFIEILSIGTTANIIFSLLFSIKADRYHGTYRFFSFESILVLVLLCVPVWFDHPLKWDQLFSWVILAALIPLPIYGFRALWIAGKPRDQIENTTALVTSSIYRHIRHSLYASLLLGGTGVFFKNITLETPVCVPVKLCAMVATARTEEHEMVVKFGEDYAN